MAGLTRKALFPFAGSSTNTGEFGSAQLGTYVLTSDPETIQGVSGSTPSTAWQNGWFDATISSMNLPPIEEMEGVQRVFGYQLSYILTRGIPEWDAITTYNQYDICKKTGTWQLYGSLIDSNIGNALPSAVSNSNWKYLCDLSSLSYPSSIGVSGYTYLPNGLILQWGSGTYVDGTGYTFPIPFPNNNFVTMIAAVGNGNAITTYSSVSLTGWTAKSNSPVGTSATVSGIFFALGN